MTVAAAVLMGSLAFGDEVTLDDASFVPHVARSGPDLMPWLHFELRGIVAPSDAIRLDWRRGGAVVGSFRKQDLHTSAPASDFPEGDGARFNSSSLSVEDARRAKTPYVEVDSLNWAGKPLKLSPGEYDIDIVLISGADDSERKLASRKVTVISHKDGTGQRLDVVHHDALGLTTGSVRHGLLEVLFWHATDGRDGSFTGAVNQPTARCSVDGKHVEKELFYKVDEADSVGYDYVERTGKKSVTHNYKWTKLRMLLSTDEAFMKANSGQWVCEFRSAGKTVRTFRFAVADGEMVKSDAQGPGGFNLAPGYTFVETKFAPTPEFDAWFVPSAMKERVAGRPWPKSSATAAVLKDLPVQSIISAGR